MKKKNDVYACDKIIRAGKTQDQEEDEKVDIQRREDNTRKWIGFSFVELLSAAHNCDRWRVISREQSAVLLQLQLTRPMVRIKTS